MKPSAREGFFYLLERTFPSGREKKLKDLLGLLNKLQIFRYICQETPADRNRRI